MERIKVRVIAQSRRGVEAARRRAIEALKEKMWREIWREEIELPTRVTEVEFEDGRIEVIAEYGTGTGY